MPAIGKPPYRRGSKKSTDMSVGILNGKPSIQVNWGGRIYGTPLSLIGAGNVKDSLDVADIRATGNITFDRNSSVYNNSNRVLMVGGLVTSGDENIAIGDTNTMSSLLPTTSSTTSLYNLAVGMDTGSNITTGAANVCLGFRAGKAVTTGSSNVMLGTSAGNTSNDAVVTGSLNVFIGHTAGQSGTGTKGGSENILIGYQAGANMGAICDVVGIGSRALATSSGERNIGIGKNAGDSGGISGDDNICIGYQSGNTITSGSDNICIGYDTDVSASGAENQVVIGKSLTSPGDNTALIAGTSGIHLKTNILYVYPSASGQQSFAFSMSGAPKFTINSQADGGDECSIAVGAAGVTTITTVDNAAAAAHLNIEADGHVEFDNCAVGFDRLEATFSTTAVIESGGTDDTDIDFRLSNKYRLEMTGDIDDINLIFPNTSGNFLLVCTTNGDHDVEDWKVWEHDSAAGATNAAGTTDVMWAGGSVPAFTTSGVDIVSFYWDADEQQCYGVVSLAFATP